MHILQHFTLSKIHTHVFIREKKSSIILLRRTLLQLKCINRTNEGPIKNLTRRFVIHIAVGGVQNNC